MAQPPATEKPSTSAKRRANRESAGGQVRGLFRRGQVFWWNSQRDGHRVRMSLETTDHGEAVRKVLEYRAQPHLGEMGRWEYEVEEYLGDQQKRRHLSASYASSRRYVLRRFAEDAG